jgi:excisionase family DNA binding protein
VPPRQCSSTGLEHFSLGPSRREGPHVAQAAGNAAYSFIVHIYCACAIVVVMAVVSVPSVPVSDAAQRLGVSEQRVRALISAGAIEAEKVGGSWWIPAQSLARVATAGRRDGGRPLSAHSAWALLLAASEEPVEWASPRMRWRVSVALRERGLSGAFGKLGNRAERHAFVAHPAELAHLRDSRELMLGGVSAAAAHRLGLQGGEGIEAYVAAGTIEHVAARHGLARGGESNVVLRSVSENLWAVLHRPVAPVAAVLADLAEHSDARARRVAREQAARLDRDRTARD